MKENSIADCYEQMIQYLHEAKSGALWADLRSRYAHPDDTEAIESARSIAASKWFMAKHLYFHNRDALNAYHKTQSKNKDTETFTAMVLVIEKEMEQEMEQILTSQTDPDIEWEGDDVVVNDDDLYSDTKDQ